MAAHPPPVPPDQQPTHGGRPDAPDAAKAPTTGAADPNLAEQGSAGNLTQNTTNKGLQKGR